jgi:hypothetical protein
LTNAQHDRHQRASIGTESTVCPARTVEMRRQKDLAAPVREAAVGSLEELKEMSTALGTGTKFGTNLAPAAANTRKPDG